MLAQLDGQGPRYTQITRALLKAIGDGTLLPGARLPSTRQLARDLNCSRNIVVLAYEQLILEGYLVTRSRARTVVSPKLPATTADSSSLPTRASARAESMLSPEGRRLVSLAKPARDVTRWLGRSPIDFVYGISEPDPRIIRRLRTSFWKALRCGVIKYGDPAGDPQLREQIADRLRASRGMICSASQIVVTNGTQQALDICGRLLLRHGDRVAVENPGYEAAHAAFAAAGATIAPIAVDSEGIDPAKLFKSANVRVVYVTPSHQFPTGAVLSAPRRHALLAWARSQRAFIIEDDYDGELRYHGEPLKAVAALQPGSDVIYCGTFAKSLFPAIRLGFLALPESIVDAVVHAKWLSDRGSSLLLQCLIRDLMVSGEFDRYLLRMKRRYVVRRDALVRSLEHHLGEDVEIGGGAMGLHIVAWLPRVQPPEIDRLIAVCAERGVGIYSVARHAVRPLRRSGLIMGYGLTDEHAIERGVSVLATAYHQVLGSVPAQR